MDELSPKTSWPWPAPARSSASLAALPVAEVFTGTPEVRPLKETIRGFKMIVGGECDSLPEQAFYMVGTIDEAFERPPEDPSDDPGAAAPPPRR